MSIEKGVDYTSSGTISKKMGNSDVAMAKDDIGKSANADVEAIPSVDTHTNGELAVEGKKLCPLRIWFEGLSSQDRSAAIGFSDDVFLHTFIEVASWSRGQEDESDRSHDGKCIDWTRTVSLDLIESKYWNFRTNGLGSTSDGNNVNEDNECTESCSIDRQDGAGSDALRIRRVNFPSSQFLSVFESVSCILPTTLKHVCGHKMNDLDSLVSFDKCCSEEILGVFDSCSTYAFGRRFLQGCMPQIGDWLEVLRREFEGSLSDVPLFAILLARFEGSVFHSWRSVSNKPYVDQDNQQLDTTHCIAESRPHHESRQKDIFVPDRFTANEQIYTYVQKHESCSSKQYFDFFLHSANEMLGSKSAISENATLRQLVLVPLSFLRNVRRNNGSLDLSKIDQVISKVLEKLDSDYSYKLEPNLRHHSRDNATPNIQSTVHKEINEGETENYDYEVQPSDPSKKKKKRRNRRQRHSNTDTKLCSDRSYNSVENCEESRSEPALSVPPDPITKHSTVGQHSQIALVLGESFDTYSERSDCSNNIKNTAPVKSLGRNELQVSRVEGVLVVSTSSAAVLQLEEDASKGNNNNVDELYEEGDVWETVENRNRANRKKIIDRTGQSAPRMLNQSSSSNSTSQGNEPIPNGGKRSRQSRQSHSRRKNPSKKVVRDILCSVLDTVDDVVKNKKKTVHTQNQQVIAPSISRPASNPWRNGPPISKLNGQPPKDPSVSPRQTAKSQGHGSILRDSPVGKTKASSPTQIVPHNTSQQGRTVVDSKEPSSPQKGVMGKRAFVNQSQPSADQNTAPTYQETVSAASNTATDDKEGPGVSESFISKSDLSSDSSHDGPQHTDRSPTLQTGKESTQTPPLPTLLSAENQNSTTSSVASSLEVPNVSHRHRSNSVDTNDVGRHVLDVCERLSQGMDLFMRRRSQALNVRRRERGALLAALQDTVAAIWPGRCHVEMYGSCAAQLDLPSSDLDVVVVGLDRNIDMIIPNVRHPSLSRSMSLASDAGGRSRSTEEGPRAAHIMSHPQLPSFHSFRNDNADRILRLASALEALPWAVQVNAIPTASVPVVKILADPSKLTGNYGEWLKQHAQYTAESVNSANLVSDDPSEKNRFQPWRGADVMNGLLSMDITFEGPEHGGIGSTAFSLRAINQACQEYNSPPERTPFVQVLMVLKELLAQRKLNEPYSGGLSSYSLLLLVVALLHERAVIREEIERAEQQRKAVAEGDVGSGFGVAAKDGHLKGESLNISIDQNRPSAQGSEVLRHSSSWASIAKNASSSQLSAADSATSLPRQIAQTKPSFVEAVTNQTSIRNTSIGNLERDSKSQIERSVGKIEANRSSVKTDTPNGNRSTGTTDTGMGTAPSFFHQSYNDIIEVLCSGETTAGKLLMHFFLYYGHYFDAQSTAIDISGKHERSFNSYPLHHLSYISPYIPRRASGSIDPRTGMLIVDPVIIYDPLEGAEHNNVARRCFAWSNVKWVFANAYSTLSKVVEESAAPEDSTKVSSSTEAGQESVSDLRENTSCLLRCLLSF